MVNAERYITQELKEYEEKILGAEDKILVLETQLYTNLVQALTEFIPQIQVNANQIARLDCLLSFAFPLLYLKQIVFSRIRNPAQFVQIRIHTVFNHSALIYQQRRIIINFPGNPVTNRNTKIQPLANTVQTCAGFRIREKTICFRYSSGKAKKRVFRV